MTEYTSYNRQLPASTTQVKDMFDALGQHCYSLFDFGIKPGEIIKIYMHTGETVEVYMHKTRNIKSSPYEYYFKTTKRKFCKT